MTAVCQDDEASWILRELGEAGLPTTSIITVTYNNLEGLKRTDESVQQLVGLDFEWIVIDGGSTDGTVEYLRHTKCSGLRWMSEKDGGIYNAMNKGIALCSGEYCIFMNAGDVFAEPASASIIQSKLVTERPNLLYGDSIESDGQEKHYKRARHPNWNHYVMFTHHQAIFYKTDKLREIRYDESYRFGADWVLTTQFLQLENFSQIQRPICIFERGGVSQRNDHRKELNKELWRIYRDAKRLPLPVASLFWLMKTQTNSFRSFAPRLYDAIRYSARPKV